MGHYYNLHALLQALYLHDQAYDMLAAPPTNQSEMGVFSQFKIQIDDATKRGGGLAEEQNNHDSNSLSIIAISSFTSMFSTTFIVVDRMPDNNCIAMLFL